MGIGWAAQSWHATGCPTYVISDACRGKPLWQTSLVSIDIGRLRLKTLRHGETDKNCVDSFWNAVYGATEGIGRNGACTLEICKVKKGKGSYHGK